MGYKRAQYKKARNKRRNPVAKGMRQTLSGSVHTDNKKEPRDLSEEINEGWLVWFDGECEEENYEY